MQDREKSREGGQEHHDYPEDEPRSPGGETSGNLPLITERRKKEGRKETRVTESSKKKTGGQSETKGSVGKSCGGWRKPGRGLDLVAVNVVKGKNGGSAKPSPNTRAAKNAAKAGSGKILTQGGGKKREAPAGHSAAPPHFGGGGGLKRHLLPRKSPGGGKKSQKKNDALMHGSRDPQ